MGDRGVCYIAVWWFCRSLASSLDDAYAAQPGTIVVEVPRQGSAWVVLAATRPWREYLDTVQNPAGRHGEHAHAAKQYQLNPTNSSPQSPRYLARAPSLWGRGSATLTGSRWSL